MSDVTKIERAEGAMAKAEVLTSAWYREAEEQQAAKLFFLPEVVTFFRHASRDDIEIECRVKCAGFKRFEWLARQIQSLDGWPAVRIVRYGTEATHEAACLAAYSMAKELAKEGT